MASSLCLAIPLLITAHTTLCAKQTCLDHPLLVHTLNRPGSDHTSKAMQRFAAHSQSATLCNTHKGLEFHSAQPHPNGTPPPRPRGARPRAQPTCKPPPPVRCTPSPGPHTHQMATSMCLGMPALVTTHIALIAKPTSCPSHPPSCTSEPACQLPPVEQSSVPLSLYTSLRSASKGLCDPCWQPLRHTPKA